MAEARVSEVLLEADIDNQVAYVSEVLLEADIDNQVAYVSEVLLEVDVSNDQALISEVLLEVDVGETDYLWIGREIATDEEYITGFRFDGIPIPADSVIYSANLRLFVLEATEAIKCRVLGIAKPDWPPFQYGYMPSDGTPLTAGSALLENVSGSPGWITSGSIQSAVQEIIYQDLWTAGCAITILVEGDYAGFGKQKVHIGPGPDAAKLDITWIAP